MNNSLTNEAIDGLGDSLDRAMNYEDQLNKDIKMSEAQKTADKMANALVAFEGHLETAIGLAEESGDAMAQSIMSDIDRQTKKLHKTCNYACRIAGLNEGK